MTTRRRNILILASVLVLSALGAYLLAPGVRERAPIEAIPNGAFLVVTLDLVKLRASPLAHELGDVREVSDVSRECGFDPLERARSVAIGVPEKPDGVFGLSIAHDLDRDDLAKCAERVMSARSATPRVTQRGSWTIVEQEGILSEATRAKIAYRDGAPLLVARGDYLATMQQTIDGPQKGLREHDELRKVAESHAGGNAVLVATALLPKSVRNKVKDELATEADTSESSVPTARETTPAGKSGEAARSQSKKATMNAVLGVTSVAVSIGSRPGSPMVDVFAELVCEDAGTCATVRDFLERKRKSLAQEPAARFVGLAGILDAVTLDAHGNVVDAEVSVPATELARSVRAVLRTAFSPAPPDRLDFPRRDE